MSDAPIGHRHGPRPRRRGLVALLLATALATCTSDRPTGPRVVGRGVLAVRPVLVAPASLSSFGLTIDSLRVAIIRPPTEIARDTTVFFNPDSSVLRLLLPVTLQASPETFTVVIELRAGATVLYSDSSVARISAGGTDSSSVAGDTLRYVGPGKTVKHLLIAPTDSVVILGGSQRFRATATDSNGTPVDSFFVSWSSSAPTTAPISKSGLLQAPTARGKVFVRAVTPTSIHDSTSVTFIPVPTTLAVSAGDGQTGGATAKLPLPLRVRVTAADTMGVKGIAVRFRALTGGGTVRDSVVLSDSLGYAADSVTLGAAFGPQTFQASVAGLPAVTFGASATGVTIHSADITGDSVWAAAQSPHVVTRYLRIVNGGTLTIEAGAVVKFDSGAGLQVGDTSLNQSGGLVLTQDTLTANAATVSPGYWRGIEVQRSLAGTQWRGTLIEGGGGVRLPFGSVPAEACVLIVNRSGAALDLDTLHIRRCVHAGIHHFGGLAHVHHSVIDSVTGSGIHADFDATLQLDSTTVRGSGQEGLLLGSPATHLAPSRFNRFLGNATFGIQMQAAQLPGLLRQDSIAGNTTDFVAVTGGQPDPTVAAFTIFAQPQRSGSNGYVVNGLLDIGRSGGQTVTLDSNLVLRFGTQSGLVIGDSAGTRSGSIVSLGTNRTNAPRLTSASLAPAPGDWYGLEMGRLSTNTRLANVRIEFAGDSIGGRSRHRFGLVVRSPAAQTLALDSVLVFQSGRAGSDTNTAGIGVLASGGGVDIRRSVAQGNLGYGFALAGVAKVKAVADTARSNTVGFALFADSGVSAVAPGDSVASNVAAGNTLYPLSLDIRRLPVLFPNSFTGNGRDTLLVDGHRITFTDTLPHFAGLPWRVTHGPIQIDSGGSLTLAAGDTLAFDVQLGIVVGASGTGVLAASGSSGAPILLTTSFVPSGTNPFGWGGIEWRQPSVAGNVFTYVTVDRGGYVLRPVCDCSPVPVAALRFADTTGATSVNLTLDHVTVRGSLGPAVQVRRVGTGAVSFTNSQFYANTGYDPMISAFLAQPNQLSITGSDLHHYRQWAISVSAPLGDSVAATNNWWGDVLGPDVGFTGADSLGRTALDGNAVSFTPFRTTPVFPVGPVAAVVTTQDSAFSTALSTADSIRVRSVDAFGRGVAAVPITMGAPSGTSISPTSGSGDAGGRFDARWQFTTSAGTKVATASASGATPGHYVATVTPGATAAVSWTLVPALSQGSVTLPRQITFTSTNRRGVIVTFAHDSFGNATQPFSLCSAAPGQTCPFAFPPEGQVDSTHTSGGTNGDTIFFHANATTPSPFVLRGTYAGPNASQLNDSVIVSMVPIPGGVKIDRDPNVQGVQAVPDTVLISSICPTGSGNAACQASYTALVVDSALTPIGQGNANFVWHLVSGSAVTFDSTNAFPHDVGYVTARANGVVVLAVKDTSGNNFGTDTLPIRVLQLPSVVIVTPDTVSVPVGGTTTFHGTVIDAAGDTMTTPIHWRNDNTVNPHVTIIDTSVANQVTVRLDSTPFGQENITAFAIGGPGDTAYGFGQVVNPLVLRLGVGLQPWAIAANSQTHAVYVGHQGGQLYQVSGTTDALVDSVPAGAFVAAVAVNPVTNRVFAGTDQGVGVFDGTALSLLQTVATGTTQRGVTNSQGLTVDSVNNRIYVSVDIGAAAPNPVLRRIDGATNTFSATNDVPLPGLGTSAAFDPVNGLVYVAIPDSNFVVAVDPVARTFTRISAGTTPTYVAVNPVTNRVYVANTSSDNITVIDASTGSVVTTISLFYTPSSIAVDAVNNRVYVGTSGLPYLLEINGATNVFSTILFVGNPSFFDSELGVAFDAGNRKVWTANYSSNSVSRLKY